MKLYYAPGACSLSPHIVAREAGVPITLGKVDFASGSVEDGTPFKSINPKGQVPTLQLDNGEIFTEGPVIAQYLADQKPDSGLMPPPGSLARYRVLEWLGYINSEVHKQFSPLFNPGASDAQKEDARKNLANRLAFIENHLDGKSFVAGDRFTAADAYTFVVLNWTNFVKIDLTPYSNIRDYLARVAARPKVQEAMKAEGLFG